MAGVYVVSANQPFTLRKTPEGSFLKGDDIEQLHGLEVIEDFILSEIIPITDLNLTHIYGIKYLDGDFYIKGWQVRGDVLAECYLDIDGVYKDLALIKDTPGTAPKRLASLKVKQSSVLNISVKKLTGNGSPHNYQSIIYV